MSSVLRSFSQIPSRVKFLIVTNATVDAAGTIPSQDNLEAFDLSGNTLTGGSIQTDTEVNSQTGFRGLELVQGYLYRDLGKQLVIKNASNAHLAIFRLARLQNAVTNEGVNLADNNIWIKVWSASGGGVVVSRTG